MEHIIGWFLMKIKTNIQTLIIVHGPTSDCSIRVMQVAEVLNLNALTTLHMQLLHP